MSYRIQYHKNFLKFLMKHQDIQQKVVESFEIIAQNPYQNALDIVKLKGEENKYRFLYAIIEKQIPVYAYKANSRGDVYQ